MATIEMFLAKKREIEQATAKVDAKLREFNEVAGLLSEPATLSGPETDPAWKWIAFVGTDCVDFPAYVRQEGAAINTDKTPDWKQLGRLIAEWHQVDASYREAWKNLSAQERNDLDAYRPQTHRAPRSGSFARARTNQH
jgi:hypothetical protein